MLDRLDVSSSNLLTGGGVGGGGRRLRLRPLSFSGICTFKEPSTWFLGPGKFGNHGARHYGELWAVSQS